MSRAVESPARVSANQEGVFAQVNGNLWSLPLPRSLFPVNVSLLEELDTDTKNLITGIIQDNGKHGTDLEPVRVNWFRNHKVVECCIGGTHNLFLTSTGGLFVQGVGSSGQLGLGRDVIECSKATLVSLFSSFPLQGVSAGNAHSAAVSKDGRLYMCGSNSSDQLGSIATDDDEPSVWEWTQIKLPLDADVHEKAYAVSCGPFSTYVVTTIGRVLHTGLPSSKTWREFPLRNRRVRLLSTIPSSDSVVAAVTTSMEIIILQQIDNDGTADDMSCQYPVLRYVKLSTPFTHRVRSLHCLHDEATGELQMVAATMMNRFYECTMRISADFDSSSSHAAARPIETDYDTKKVQLASLPFDDVVAFTHLSSVDSPAVGTPDDRKTPIAVVVGEVHPQNLSKVVPLLPARHVKKLEGEKYVAGAAEEDSDQAVSFIALLFDGEIMRINDALMIAPLTP